MKELFGLAGKTAVVTGGSRGLGYMIAKGFLKAGAKRVYISSRKLEDCCKAALSLSDYGECIGVASDVAKLEDIKEFVKKISGVDEKIDVLVNNAGKYWWNELKDFPERGWDTVNAVNVKGAFYMSREMFPLLKEAGTHKDPARIINISSAAAFCSDANNVYSYGASKASLNWLTRTMAKEFVQYHITVNAIAPGRFPSQMTQGIIDDVVRYNYELNTIPLHRYGNEDDIAGLSIFLASKAGSYITGTVIVQDGGVLLI